MFRVALVQSTKRTAEELGRHEIPAIQPVQVLGSFLPLMPVLLRRETDCER